MNMRLLHSTDWRFEEFFDDIPPYVVLSHRWGKREISHSALSRAIDKSNETEDVIIPGDGFLKIKKCREIAAAEYLEWVWIDTCCINKESSTELSEAINSMYRWYHNAELCYIYLSDVGQGVPSDEGGVNQGDIASTSLPARDKLLKKFVKSRWFTRGWTLQELLAPKWAVFYDSSWNRIGTRAHLAHVIEEATSINSKYLVGESKLYELAHTSVAKKMSWIAKRTTSRAEDIAYCMLGLFNVNMPLLYGEGGRQAFMRLQLEIIRQSNDESIFAWGKKLRRGTELGMLATSPLYFADCGDIESLAPDYRTIDRLPYAMTNQGLHIDVNVRPERRAEHESGSAGIRFGLKLNCYRVMAENENWRQIQIVLEKEASGQSKQWRRCGRCIMRRAPKPKSSIEEEVTVAFYIRQAKTHLGLPEARLSSAG